MMTPVNTDSVLALFRRVGALLEGLVGPLAPDVGDDPARAKEAVQALTLIALRGLGVAALCRRHVLRVFCGRYARTLGRVVILHPLERHANLHYRSVAGLPRRAP